MLKFHTLTVESVRPQGEDAVEITFAVPEALQADYRFDAGQHLNIQASVDGEDIRRSYSICSPPSSGRLCIGVRRVEGGAFSSFANQALQPGDHLEVMTPTGHFNTPLDPARARSYVAFAAGSGITPVLSIIADILETEPRSRVQLFYGNRSLASTMFRETLMDLKNLYMSRLSLQFVLSREQTELDICNGRIDGARATELLQAFCGEHGVDEVFICGPDSMIDEVAAAAQAFGVDPRCIHYERFATNPKARAQATRARPARRDSAAGHSRVTIVMDTHQREFDMPRDGDNIVDAAAAAGIELPYSCKSAVCSTCRARLVEGEVDMAANYALEPWELEAGYVLACQCVPTSEHIVLDYDQ